MSQHNPTASRAAVIREIADRIEGGAPIPISLTLYTAKVQVLCHGVSDWERWVAEFGGSPIDASYHPSSSEEGASFGDWSNDRVKVSHVVYKKAVA